MPINSLGVSTPQIPLENREAPAPVQQHAGEQRSAEAQALPAQSPGSGRSNFRRFLSRVASCEDCVGVDENAIVNPSKYRASLNTWMTSANPKERPAREIACKRILAWQAAGRMEDALNLGLENPYDDDPAIPRLTKLPPLPLGVRILNAAGHKLKKLPDNLPDSLKLLNVSYNKLRTWPARLPASLRKLNAGYNKLESLPDNFPDSLKQLNASYNRFKKLPDSLPDSLMELNVSCTHLSIFPVRLPASLRKLNVSLNGLQYLPASLPPHLTELKANGTEIESLPDDLPDSLIRLSASYCKITEIPASVLAAASRREAPCEIDLRTNPLSANAWRQIEEHNRNVISNGVGRQIRINETTTAADGTNEYGVGRRSATLEQAVQAWFEPDPDHESSGHNRETAWRNIREEAIAHANADADPTLPFWTLLDSLNGTAAHGIEEGAAPETSAAQAARVAFRKRVATLLDVMEKDKELREACFSIPFDVSQSCHDNVALRFDQMEQVHLTLRAARGELTQEEVFKLGLGTFKLQIMDELTKAEALAMNISKEELEVVLYYRTKLADTLDLPIQTKSMVNEQFVLAAASMAAGNTEAADKEVQEADKNPGQITKYLDVEAVGEEVQKAASDPEQITQFLVEWAPWQKSLERLHPEAFDAEAVEAEKAKVHQEQAQLEEDCSNGRGAEGWLQVQAMEALMKRYNHMEDILFRDTRKRMTEEFLKANTALWSC